MQGSVMHGQWCQRKVRGSVKLLRRAVSTRTVLPNPVSPGSRVSVTSADTRV